MTDRVLTFFLVAAGIAVVGFQVWAKPRPSDDDIRHHAEAFFASRVWDDRIAPDFELTLLDGSRFRVADHIGTRVIVLNFFATWCGPCRAEMPELERYYREHADKGVLLLGIDAEEKHTVVEPFIAEMKLTFPVGIDASGDVLKLYGIRSFPTTVVIGADGKVKLYETGAILNADVGLRPIVDPEIAAVGGGRGITKDAYIAALAQEPSEAGEAKPLEGRGRTIAEAMPCPCGCTDKVMACRCSTASGIKARLAQGGYEGKTDAEVMQELNREFCMKGM